MSGDEADKRSAKRIRLACLDCRRKKVRCSGDRPYCALCRRIKKVCVYAEDEPWDRPSIAHESGSLSSPGRFVSNEEVVARLDGLESKLNSLQSLMESIASSLNVRRPSTSGSTRTSPRGPSQGISTTSPSSAPAEVGSPSSAPSPEDLLAAADAYFQCCHNQPYCLFHEGSFRARLKTGTVPKALLYAFLATARRFQSGPNYQGQNGETISSLAMTAWDALTLPWGQSALDYPVALSMIQAIHLLSILDYTDGKCSTAWLKLGIAIRVAQHIRLTIEPDASLPPIEKEEHRRVFWSLYILDKLMSCGRERTAALLDEDCKVRLPCIESAFRAGIEGPEAPLLENLTGESPSVTSLDHMSSLALVVLASSILSRVAVYTLQEHKFSGDNIPWRSGSQHAILDSILLQVESNFGFGEPLTNAIEHDALRDGYVDHDTAGPLIFARALFHLCYCLLDHPFLLQQQLLILQKKSPASFLTRSQDSCRSHAQALSSITQQVTGFGCKTIWSFYGYCQMVAGSIHALFLHQQDQSAREASQNFYNVSLNCLRGLSNYWPTAGFMVVKLEKFRQSNASSTIPDASSSRGVQSVADMRTLWESVDHWALSMPTPPNDEGSGKSLSEIAPMTPANIIPNLDLSFFDFISHPLPADPSMQGLSLMGFSDEVERLVAIGDFADTQGLGGLSSSNGLW